MKKTPKTIVRYPEVEGYIVQDLLDDFDVYCDTLDEAISTFLKKREVAMDKEKVKIRVIHNPYLNVEVLE